MQGVVFWEEIHQHATQSSLSRWCCSQSQAFLFQITRLDEAQGCLKKHTEANHMIWYLSGHFARWCNLKQEHFTFYGLLCFTVSLIHCPLFRRCPKFKSRVCAWHCGSHSACWKTPSCFELLGPRQTVALVLFLFICGRICVITSYDQFWLPTETARRYAWRCRVPRQHSVLARILMPLGFSHISRLPASRHATRADGSRADLQTTSKCVWQGDDLTTCSYFPSTPLSTPSHCHPRQIKS